MAGFWTGLVHGTLMCGATLAALSLAFPRESDAPQGMGDIAADNAAVVGDAAPAAISDLTAPSDAGSSAQVAPAPADTAPRVTVPETAPAAERPAPTEPALVDGAALAGQSAMDDPPTGAAEDASASPVDQLPDPVGSDFRRGSDDPPRVPEASPAPIDRHIPRSVSASTEIAPPVAPTPGEVPPVSAAPAAPGPLSPEPFAPESFAPEPLVAPSLEPSMTVATPGRMAAPGLDSVPQPSGPAEVTEVTEPVPANRTTTLAVPQPNTGGAANSRADSGRIPRPAPDLSIPRALFPAGAARTAPALPQPTAAMPPAPDLSDLNPGASR